MIVKIAILKTHIPLLHVPRHFKGSEDSFLENVCPLWEYLKKTELSMFLANFRLNTPRVSDCYYPIKKQRENSRVLRRKLSRGASIHVMLLSNFGTKLAGSVPFRRHTVLIFNKLLRCPYMTKKHSIWHLYIKISCGICSLPYLEVRPRRLVRHLAKHGWNWVLANSTYSLVCQVSCDIPRDLAL